MQVGPVSPLNPIYAEETEKRKHPEGVVNRSAEQGGEYLYVFFLFHGSFICFEYCPCVSHLCRGG